MRAKRFKPKKGVTYRWFLWDENVGQEQTARVWHVNKAGDTVMDGSLPLEEARKVCARMECPWA